MTQVLQYRFGQQAVGGQVVVGEDGGAENGRSDLQGHAFGNLLLAALTGITGSFDEALLAAERVLRLRGRVLPSTLEPIILEADVEIAGHIATDNYQGGRLAGEAMERGVTIPGAPPWRAWGA